MAARRAVLLAVLAVALSLEAERIPTSGPRVPGDLTTSGASGEEISVGSLDPMRDPKVLSMIRHLWTQARLGSVCYERAAWIVREPDGSHSCIQVPPTYQCYQLEFSPEKPYGAVAFVHTHPSTNGTGRRDEGADRKAAGKIGIPLYTVEKGGLLRYDPSTDELSMRYHGLRYIHDAATEPTICKVQSPEQIRQANFRRTLERETELARLREAAADGAVLTSGQ